MLMPLIGECQSIDIDETLKRVIDLLYAAAFTVVCSHVGTKPAKFLCLASFDRMIFACGAYYGWVSVSTKDYLPMQNYRVYALLRTMLCMPINTYEITKCCKKHYTCTGATPECDHAFVGSSIDCSAVRWLDDYLSTGVLRYPDEIRTYPNRIVDHHSFGKQGSIPPQIPLFVLAPTSAAAAAAAAAIVETTPFAPSPSAPPASPVAVSAAASSTSSTTTAMSTTMSTTMNTPSAMSAGHAAAIAAAAIADAERASRHVLELQSQLTAAMQEKHDAWQKARDARRLADELFNRECPG